MRRINSSFSTWCSDIDDVSRCCVATAKSVFQVVEAAFGMAQYSTCCKRRDKQAASDNLYENPQRLQSQRHIWHPGTQSAIMSKITNDDLTPYDTGCFIAVPIWEQWASKGWPNGLHNLRRLGNIWDVWNSSSKQLTLCTSSVRINAYFLTSWTRVEVRYGSLIDSSSEHDWRNRVTRTAFSHASSL